MSADVITPLEGEPAVPGVAPPKTGGNSKRMAAAAFMLLSLIAIVGFTVTRFFGKAADAPEKPSDPPVVASTVAPDIKMPPAPQPAASQPGSTAGAASGPTTAGTQPAVTVPGIAPLPGDTQAIAVQGTGGAPSSGAAPIKVANPDDAPIFASGAAPDMHAPAVTPQGRSSNRADDANASLEAYQRQLAGMLQNLQSLSANNAAAAHANTPTTAAPTPTPAQTPALFGSLDRSATPTVMARQLGDRNMIVPKGTLFLCSLKTRVISATSGFVGCQVTRNVYSDNGRVLLIERGSHMDGEYRIVAVRPGVTRIPVLWTRLRSPQGVTVDLDSPATGGLGESGMGGYVDNRWGERLGGALMLSLVNDALKYAVDSQNKTGSGNTVILPNTTDQGSKLAEKVLETTINIPPLIYQNQGGVVGVYVARDVDFSSVYELKPQ